jgi:ABC-type antimicrobial peptide transport system permease subunit
MHYRYRPYPYYRRYYDINPYYYGRYYNPFYNYQRNIIDSQIASIDQNITNFGDMRDVRQDANIYQLRSAVPEDPGIPLHRAESQEPSALLSIIKKEWDKTTLFLFYFNFFFGFLFRS